METPDHGSRCEILATGDELMTGAIADTNGAWAAGLLREAGVAVDRMVVVGDGLDRIQRAVREAAARSPVLIVSGGLGPTEDDRTLEAVAAAAGVRRERSDRALAHVTAFFVSVGLPMSSNNEKQADLPAGSEILDNPVGTAVGIVVQIGSCRVFCLPGVPDEYRRMLQEQVLPRLPSPGRRRLATRILKVYGGGESSLETELAGLDWPSTVTVGYRALFPEIHLRVYARGEGELETDLDSVEAAVRGRIGVRLFGVGDATLAATVGQLARQSRVRLAAAESCTGGLLGATITETAGASEWFDRSLVTYSNRAKSELLGVPEATIAGHGAVSEATVRAMASGARLRSGVELAVAITGIAGPGGGTPEKPVGTVWIAVDTAKEQWTRLYRFRGDRDRIRRAAVWAALDGARRALGRWPTDGWSISARS